MKKLSDIPPSEVEWIDGKPFHSKRNGLVLSLLVDDRPREKMSSGKRSIYGFNDGDMLSSRDVLSYIHSRHEDFEDDQRVQGRYIVSWIDVDRIDDSVYGVDDYKVSKYSSKKTPFPPIVLDASGDVIDGGHRIAAAKERGDKEIMVIYPAKISPRFKNLKEIRESLSSEKIKLYHGTTKTSADMLLKNGWYPNSGCMGGHCGNPKYLYLTNFHENAMWYSNEKGESVVLQVDVNINDIKVDPDDGVSDNVNDELNLSHGLPGNFVLTKSIPGSSFKMH